MILTISVTSLFEINSVNHFAVLTAPFSFIFLSNLYIALEVKLLTNPGKLSLAKGIGIYVSYFLRELEYMLVLFFLNYLSKNQKFHLVELF